MEKLRIVSRTLATWAAQLVRVHPCTPYLLVTLPLSFVSVVGWSSPTNINTCPAGRNCCLPVEPCPLPPYITSQRLTFPATRVECVVYRALTSGCERIACDRPCHMRYELRDFGRRQFGGLFRDITVRTTAVVNVPLANLRKL